MSHDPPIDNKSGLGVIPVDKNNWRAVTKLQVSPEQRAFVATPSYYLALCCYESVWHPLAITLGEQVIGFCMWGVDTDDESCWLGGIFLDEKFQGQRYGKRAVKQAITMLVETYGHKNFALSYQPVNNVAKKVYQSLGFAETDEWVDDEIVARLTLSDRLKFAPSDN